ncbi:unnamed protein product, partial [Mesorhabditis spiculigera]
MWVRKKDPQCRPAYPNSLRDHTPSPRDCSTRRGPSFCPVPYPRLREAPRIPLVSDTTAALMDTPEPAVTVPVPEEAVEVFNTRHYGNYNDVSEQSANNDVDLEQHRIGSYGRLNGANVFE